MSLPPPIVPTVPITTAIATRKLADSIVAAPKAANSPQDSARRRVWAVVNSISTGASPTVSLKIAGSASVVPGVKFARSYSPVVGDTVFCEWVGTDLVVQGAVSTGYQDEWTWCAGQTTVECLTNLGATGWAFDVLQLNTCKAPLTTLSPGGSWTYSGLVIPVTGTYSVNVGQMLGSSPVGGVWWMFHWLCLTTTANFWTGPSNGYVAQNANLIGTPGWSSNAPYQNLCWGWKGQLTAGQVLYLWVEFNSTSGANMCQVGGTSGNFLQVHHHAA